MISMTQIDAQNVSMIEVDGERRKLRRELFTETPYQRLERWLFGTYFAVRPPRTRFLGRFLWEVTLDMARGGTSVPDPGRVHACPELMGGVCRNISPRTIMAAGRLGFSPWCHLGPLKWWTREKRMVLFFDEHHMSKRFRPLVRNASYSVTFDTAFEHVIKGCSERRSYRRHGLTWITPRIMKLYTELYDQGHAHSIEIWNRDGRLVGGTYGLSLGRIFITESQFFRESNASKIGYAVLNYHLARWGYVLNDNKGHTPATEAMGFREIPRAEYEAILTANAHSGGRSGRWSVEYDLATVANWKTARDSKGASPDAPRRSAPDSAAPSRPQPSS